MSQQIVTDLQLLADPTVGPGFAAPIFARGIFNGVPYIKTGAPDTAWSSTFPSTPLASLTPSTVTSGSAGAVGVSTNAAREDHAHPVPAPGAPQPVGTTAVAGSSTKLAREDHAHVGVHNAIAGAGISVSSATGDVTFNAGTLPARTLYVSSAWSNNPDTTRYFTTVQSAINYAAANLTPTLVNPVWIEIEPSDYVEVITLASFVYLLGLEQTSAAFAGQEPPAGVGVLNVTLQQVHWTPVGAGDEVAHVTGCTIIDALAVDNTGKGGGKGLLSLQSVYLFKAGTLAGRSVASADQFMAQGCTFGDNNGGGATWSTNFSVNQMRDCFRASALTETNTALAVGLKAIYADVQTPPGATGTLTFNGTAATLSVRMRGCSMQTPTFSGTVNFDCYEPGNNFDNVALPVTTVVGAASFNLSPSVASYILDASAGAVTVTLPDTSQRPGQKVDFKVIGGTLAFPVTFNAVSGTVNGVASYTVPANQNFRIISDPTTTDWKLLFVAASAFFNVVPARTYYVSPPLPDWSAPVDTTKFFTNISTAIAAAFTDFVPDVTNMATVMVAPNTFFEDVTLKPNVQLVGMDGSSGNLAFGGAVPAALAAFALQGSVINGNFFPPSGNMSYVAGADGSIVIYLKNIRCAGSLTIDMSNVGVTSALIVMDNVYVGGGCFITGNTGLTNASTGAFALLTNCYFGNNQAGAATECFNATDYSVQATNCLFDGETTLALRTGTANANHGFRNCRLGSFKSNANYTASTSLNCTIADAGQVQQIFLWDCDLPFRIVTNNELRITINRNGRQRGWGSPANLVSPPQAPRAQVSTITGSYTVARNDEILFMDSTSGNCTATLPSANANVGMRLIFKRKSATGTNVCRVSAGTSTLGGGSVADTIDDLASVTLQTIQDTLVVESIGAQVSPPAYGTPVGGVSNVGRWVRIATTTAITTT